MDPWHIGLKQLLPPQNFPCTPPPLKILCFWGGRNVDLEVSTASRSSRRGPLASSASGNAGRGPRLSSSYASRSSRRVLRALFASGWPVVCFATAASYASRSSRRVPRASSSSGTAGRWPRLGRGGALRCGRRPQPGSCPSPPVVVVLRFAVAVGRSLCRALPPPWSWLGASLWTDCSLVVPCRLLCVVRFGNTCRGLRWRSVVAVRFAVAGRSLDHAPSPLVVVACASQWPWAAAGSCSAASSVVAWRFACGR